MLRYLTMKIMEEGASQMIECPGDCKIIVDDKMVVLASDVNTAEN